MVLGAHGDETVEELLEGRVVGEDGVMFCVDVDEIEGLLGELGVGLHAG